MSDVQVVLIIAIAGAGIWFVLMYASSVLGGWSTLAHAYRATQPFKGRLWHGQFVAMRHYWGYGLITVGASSEGLHMSLYVLGPLQYHPALFIPWRDVTVGKRARFKAFYEAELKFHRAPEVPVRINASFLTKLSSINRKLLQ